MKQLDYEKLKEESRRFGIPSATHIKRAVNYRKSKSEKTECIVCVNRCTVTFPKQLSRTQCQIIGVDYNRSADIYPDYTCDYFSDVLSD